MIGNIGEIGQNVRRGISPSDVSQDTPYIGLEHMPRRSIELSEWGRAGDAISNKFRFHRGEILFGKLRPYFHKVGIASVDGVCSTDVLVVVPQSDEWFGPLLGHLSSVDFINYVDAGSGGTRMPRTSWEAMARYPIVVPSLEAAKAYTRLVTPWFAEIRTHIAESHTLARIRDALLPQLLSGEIRVKDPSDGPKRKSVTSR